MCAASALVVVHRGMEELECIASVDLLRRAGTAVTLAYLGDGSDAPGAEKAVVGKNGITVLADTQLSELPKDAVFDLVMIPGGPGVPGLRKTGEAAGLLKQQALRGGWIGCICAAPVLLKDAGLLEGRRYSCHPSVAKELPDGMTDDVVIDGLSAIRR